MPGMEDITGLTNYRYFLTDPAFFTALINTRLLVGGVLFITIFGGILLAPLLDQPFWGQGIVRVLVIAPFYVMPTVSALVWKSLSGGVVGHDRGLRRPRAERAPCRPVQ